MNDPQDLTNADLSPEKVGRLMSRLTHYKQQAEQIAQASRRLISTRERACSRSSLPDGSDIS